MSETTEKLRTKCSVVGCNRRAEWRIDDETMEDEYTDVCGEHISKHVSNFLRRVRPICTEEFGGSGTLPVTVLCCKATPSEADLKELKELFRNTQYDVTVSVDVCVLSEFDRLLTLLQTIHLMTDDDRIKAFIEAEAAQVPGTPLAHTFDLLSKAGELTFDPVANTYIAEALAALDDAKQCVVEDAVHFVVLDTLHKYLDGLVGKRIDTSVTLQTEM